MKNYLKLTSLALALFLTSQSAQAMNTDEDNGARTHSITNKSGENQTIDDIDFEDKKRNASIAIKIGFAIYQFWAGESQ